MRGQVALQVPPTALRWPAGQLTQKVGGDEALYCVPAGHDRQTVFAEEEKVREGQGEQEEEPDVEATVPCSACVRVRVRSE